MPADQPAQPSMMQPQQIQAPAPLQLVSNFDNPTFMQNNEYLVRY